MYKFESQLNKENISNDAIFAYLKKFLISSNDSHLGLRLGLSDINLKENHPRTITARFGVIWLIDFRGEDFQRIFLVKIIKIYNFFSKPNYIVCEKVCQQLATDWWFSPGPPLSSTNNTDCHDITEILLKVVLITIKQTNQNISAKPVTYPRLTISRSVIG